MTGNRSMTTRALWNRGWNDRKATQFQIAYCTTTNSYPLWCTLPDILLLYIIKRLIIWNFFNLKKTTTQKNKALTSSSVHCGRCSATTTILSSLRTVMEKMAILREGKHAHFELVLSQKHQFISKSDNSNGFDDLNKWRYNRSSIKPPWGGRGLFTDSPFTTFLGGGGEGGLLRQGRRLNGGLPYWFPV